MRFIASVLLAIFIAGGVQAAEIQFPKNGAIGLAPPSGMREAAGFQGFEHESGASILILELPPGGFDELRNGLTDAALATKGIKADTREDVTLDDGSRGLLITGTQTVPSVTVRKWMLIVGAPDQRTAIVTAQIPVISQAIQDAEMRRAILGVQYGRTPSLDEKVAALPFVLSERADLVVFDVIAGSGLVMRDSTLGDDLIVVMASSLAPVGDLTPLGGRAGFAHRALFSTAKLTKISTVSEQEIEVGGDPTYEIILTAQENGKRVKAVHWVRFHQNTYLRMIAVVTADKFDAHYPRFVKVRDGISFR